MESSHSLPQRPKIFVGSTTTGGRVAERLAAGLADTAEVAMGFEGVTNVARAFDVAVFVLHGGLEGDTLLRLGVFLGALGRDRIVVVLETLGTHDVPTDLRGVNLAQAPSDSGSDPTAMGILCDTVREYLRHLSTTQIPAGTPTPQSEDVAPHVARRVRRSLGSACSVRSGQTLRIADISVTGALLETYGEIPEHQLIDFDLTLENGRHVGVTAKVVRIQHPQWGRVGGVGVAFTRFEGDSRAILESYLDSAPAATSSNALASGPYA